MVRALRPRRGGRRARSAVDHSSIWRFRQRVEYSLSEKLLAEVNHQLDARGLIVKCGTLVDATIIAAAVKPPSFEEGVVSERDPDASFRVKSDETPLAKYKLHLAVDEESGLVREAEMTSADLIPPGRSLHGRRVGAGREAQGRGRQPVRLRLCAHLPAAVRLRRGRALSGVQANDKTRLAHAYAMWASPGSRPERPRR